MKVGHLFAGAGGGLLASKILGHTNVFAVELEPYPAEILRQRAAEGWFPGLQVHEQDCRLFDPSEYIGRVDAIHAGFPCQDISFAGTGAGINGSKSGLWSEIVRVAGILRPAELFLENSPAIITRGLDRVLGDLVGLGYDARWLILPASAVGAPHERGRWWCLARRANADKSRLKSRREGSCLWLRQPENKRVDWWANEPGMERVAYGVADQIYRGESLGNGQVPLCAATAYILLCGQTPDFMEAI